jgi:predicted regulator of Ras-like GTPase activity (Roadblock/LC7/MglB family)
VASYISVLRNTIKRLSSREGVMGVIILDKDGFTLDSDLDAKQSEKISAHIGSLVSRVLDVVNAGQNIKNLKKNNQKWSLGQLSQILISLETIELLIIPNEELGYNVVLLQKAIF